MAPPLDLEGGRGALLSAANWPVAAGELTALAAFGREGVLGVARRTFKARLSLRRCAVRVRPRVSVMS